MEPVPVLLSREISADFNSVGKNKSMISQLTVGQKLFLPPPASPAGGATGMCKKLIKLVVVQTGRGGR